MTVRTRVRRKAIDSSVSAAFNMKDVKDLVDKIETTQQDIARMQKEVVEDLNRLHAHMIGLKVMEVVGDVGKGERYTPSGRGKTEIDKQAYFNAVNLEDFLESVSVSVTKAREYLSGKELQSIATKVPAEKKPEAIRVVPIA